MNYELKQSKSKKRPLNYDKIIGLLLMIFFGILYLFFTLKANLDLSEGKHLLFMDEQIVYNGVDQILSSKNTTQFLNNITHEGDHRYGKVLFNLNSLFSAIPRSIWSEPGQIISTRLLQTLALFLAYILFSFTFVKSWTLKGVLFLVLLTLPSTSYYVTMPKPEPLQILFIAIFLFFASKKSYKFGKHWFYLGLAFGAKISALPIIAFYFIVSLFQSKKDLKRKSFPFRKIIVSIIAAVIGFLMAEPMLLYGKFRQYINSTFRNTTHGLDDETVGVIDWVKLTINECSVLHNIILILGLVCIFHTLFLVFNKDSKLNILGNDKGYLTTFLGFFILLLYMFRVDRLWGFYIQIPLILISCGVFVYIEKLIQHIIFTKRIRKVVTLLLIIPLVFLFSLAVKADNIEYNRLASRTAKPKHKKKILEYDYLNTILDSIWNSNKKSLDIYFDPKLYLLESNDSIKIIKFPGYFTKWEDSFDAIIYYKKQGEDLKNIEVSETNIRYKKWENAIKLYDQYTTNTNNIDSIVQLIKNDKDGNQNFGKWITNGDWIIDNNNLNKLTKNHIDVRNLSLNLQKSSTYLLTFEVIDFKSGNLFYKFGGGSSNKIKNIKSGNYSIEVTHDGELDNFQFSGSFIGTIKNVSLKNLSNHLQSSNQKLLYIKLSDSNMPKDLEILLRSDIFINYKTQ